jgi:hypothetical protein
MRRRGPPGGCGGPSWLACLKGAKAVLSAGGEPPLLFLSSSPELSAFVWPSAFVWLSDSASGLLTLLPNLCVGVGFVAFVVEGHGTPLEYCRQKPLLLLKSTNGDRIAGTLNFEKGSTPSIVFSLSSHGLYPPLQCQKCSELKKYLTNFHSLVNLFASTAFLRKMLPAKRQQNGPLHVHVHT